MLKRKSRGRKIESGEGAMGLATWQASLISDIYHPRKGHEGGRHTGVWESFAELPKRRGFQGQEWRRAWPQENPIMLQREIQSMPARVYK